MNLAVNHNSSITTNGKMKTMHSPLPPLVIRLVWCTGELLNPSCKAGPSYKQTTWLAYPISAHVLCMMGWLSNLLISFHPMHKSDLITFQKSSSVPFPPQPLPSCSLYLWKKCLNLQVHCRTCSVSFAN